MKKTLLLIPVAGLAAVLLLVAGGCTNPETPAGHEGFVYERPRILGKGGFIGTIDGPGRWGMTWRRLEVINIDTRPQTFDEEFKILAADDLNITFRFHVVVRVMPGGAKDTVEKYGGEEWYARYLREPLNTFVREAVQQHSSTEIKSNRGQIAETVRASLAEYIDGTPFELTKLVVGNVDYPEIVSRAVEQKLAAQQLLAEKETQLAIAVRDAEVRVAEARGIAEAQQIINETLTPYYLQHEAIEAQKLMANSPNHTTVYIPVGTNGIPIVHDPDSSVTAVKTGGPGN